MNKFRLTTDVTVYHKSSELPAAHRQLLQQAKKAARNAYAPYSHFKVGAAVLLKNGKVVVGNNQENASFPAGLCAESVALFAAAAQFPSVPVKAIAITVISKKQNIHEPVAPCGNCRQVFMEYENRYGKDIEVILMGDKGSIFVIPSAKDLLPLSFTAKYF